MEGVEWVWPVLTNNLTTDFASASVTMVYCFSELELLILMT